MALTHKGQELLSTRLPDAREVSKWRDNLHEAKSLAVAVVPKKRKITQSHCAKPLDIFVQFALGARVLSKYGTFQARQIAAISPLTQEDWFQRHSQDSELPLRLTQAINASREWWGQFIGSPTDEDVRDRIAHWLLTVEHEAGE